MKWSSMYRCDSTHGEGKLYSGNNYFFADIDPDIGSIHNQ